MPRIFLKGKEKRKSVHFFFFTFLKVKSLHAKKKVGVLGCFCQNFTCFLFECSLSTWRIQTFSFQRQPILSLPDLTQAKVIGPMGTQDSFNLYQIHYICLLFGKSSDHLAFHAIAVFPHYFSEL